MAKRIVTKIGDVFCVEVDGRYKQFFQYIANDMTCMNSSTIRVFKRRYAMDYKPIVDDIVNDEVEFYAHTILKIGIVDGAWYKVGKSKELGLDALSNVFFACFTWPLQQEKYNPLFWDWNIWKFGGEWTVVHGLSEEIRKKVERGDVFNWRSIVDRIKNGYYDSPDFF